MSPEMLASLCLFAFSTSITPGPNNAMLFASGVNHGVRRTMPHLLGVTLGFTFMQLAVGLGVSAAFEVLPGLYPALRAFGLAYMLYLAWRIATSAPAEQQSKAHATGERPGRPMTFLEASAFQWVNPKALMMCVTAASAYAPPDRPVMGALVVTGVFFVAGMPCVALWVLLGRLMRSMLQDRARLVLFNRAMALLLLASMAPMAQEALREGLF
ncbi:Threonine/homoserine/homoserine lactone efflux protein [Humidesulfovibrio mexicanus]|uniref:Threonine/homoserine/homoserine lactone efflux protein n=1 Tax=Humidesulfovibrio mexicanus TaxID=147047 RepID=A0A238XYG6_9BACT|nr:LysE family translocator [Humidesulfovibrio mexicanus]SNR63750.1 Threonine/homoserine/homoserine lactone efflux protein [Humidesulfovibrio mexicanus]